MDEFTVIGAGGKPKPGTLSPSPCSPAATSVVTDREDKRYRTPFEWLATYDPGSITTRWRKSLGENFCCAFCNRKEKHHPLKCPLLGELDLKLIDISGGNHGSSLGSTPLAGAQGGAPSATPPAAAQAAVIPPPAPASGSPSAPAGLMATVEEGDESFTDSFCRDGDDDGVDFKSNGSVSVYPPSTVFSDPLLPLPLLLRRPVLGCPWNRRCLRPPMVGLFINCPCQMRTLCRTILSFLQALCLLCSRLSPPRSSWTAFNWSWRTPVQRTTWSRTVLPSSHTR